MNQASRPLITDAAKITRLIRMRTSMSNGLLIADRTASYNQPLFAGSGLRMPAGCRILLDQEQDVVLGSVLGWGSRHIRRRRYEDEMRNLPGCNKRRLSEGARSDRLL